MKRIFLILLFLLFGTTEVAYATLGVGVGVGKIRVEEDLKPGIVYNLPSIPVLNTGDEVSEYELGIEHHENQPELIPEESWFIFSPKTFKLEPGKAQQVNIKLNLPINAKAGDYFAYVEARPIKKSTDGSITSVNIAAATKLNFTVVSASILWALYYKIISFWTSFAPWPQIVLTIIILTTSILIIKKFINIEIKLAKRHFPKWILILISTVLVIIYIIFWIKYFQVI